MRMQYGLSAYDRARGDLPPLPVINMVVEQAPTEETRIALQSRPGLSDRAQTIGGDVAALFHADGVLSGSLFGVAGGYLYEDGIQVGALDGSGAVSIAGNELGIMIACGASLWYYDGVTLSAVAFPDAANVAKVFTGGSRFWAIRSDTGKIYWTPALDVTVDGIAFATAESLPDKLLDAIWIDDIAVLFGSESVEFWPNTSDDPPIAPLEGRVFSKGIRATGCVAQWGETFAWVGNDNTVYINGDGPQPVTNADMQALIEASTDCSLWSFRWEGQDFLVLRIDAHSFVYGSRNRSWSEFTSYGETNWLAKCYAGGIFGCSNGKTAVFSSGWEDFGGVMERRFRGGYPVNSGGDVINNIILRCNTGQTTYVTGDYVEPVVEMHLSRNLGKTWSEQRSRSLGVQGEYGKRVMWRGLGMISQPGLLAEWRVTAPVDFRTSDVLINERLGGR